MTTFRLAFFKGTHAGMNGIYNRLVRARGRGLYSHVEMCFSDGVCASASYMDGGVRFKTMTLADDDPDWDFINLPVELEAAGRDWFTAHEGRAYDFWGNIALVIGFVGDSPDNWFCSEAVAAALGIEESWRLEPNALYVVVKRLVSDSVHTLAASTT